MVGRSTVVFCQFSFPNEWLVRSALAVFRVHSTTALEHPPLPQHNVIGGEKSFPAAGSQPMAPAKLVTNNHQLMTQQEPFRHPNSIGRYERFWKHVLEEKQ